MPLLNFHLHAGTFQCNARCPAVQSMKSYGLSNLKFFRKDTTSVVSPAAKTRRVVSLGTLALLFSEIGGRTGLVWPPIALRMIANLLKEL